MSTSADVRCRFAPSPTGYLHLGSARTALFNWAFARRHGGRFLLRIEDSDRQRSTAESEQALIEGLGWLGLDWDEEWVRQSERSARHAERLAELVEGGRAYRCICTREELEERRQKTIEAGGKWTYDGRCRDAEYGDDCGPHTLRLRLQESGHLGWNDGVFGALGQDAGELGDQIIRRSDGGALYNFAVVVDDIDMRISHVIRGADHQVNTAFQVAIYRTLDAELPEFAHLPLIVNDKGKKLSKRRDPVAVQHYRDQGFLADAMRNWLVRIGWSHGDEEIFSRDDIARLFDLASVGRSAGQADIAKLEWLNQHYLKELPGDALLERVLPYVRSAASERSPGTTAEATPALAALCELLRERSHTLAEMANQALWLVVPSEALEYEAKAAKKHLTQSAAAILEALESALGALESWDDASIEACFGHVRAAHDDIGMGKLAQPVRVALTGGSASPGIFETLAAAGRPLTLERLARARSWIAENRGA